MAWTAGQSLTAADLNLYLPQTYSTWSPTISAGSGSFTSVAASDARYIVLGKTCHWALKIVITTVGTASASTQFTLPVTAQRHPIFIGNGRENAINGEHLQVITTSTTQGAIFNYSNSAGAAMGAGAQFFCSGTYETA